jgi:transcriptional regulator with XRE-family HTH domain
MKTRLRNLREDNDLTQKELSKILNISQVAYSYYELNKRSIPLELLSKIADFYNTSVDYLLFRTDIQKPYPKAQVKAKPAVHKEPAIF